MRMHRNDIPVTLEAPGAVARQAVGFGDPGGSGPLGGEYFSLGSGTDIAPLLQGLPGDACQVPHWGYVVSGEAVVTYGDGTEETCSGGDLFYWPPGHTVRVIADAEVVLFSPQVDHAHVLEHMGAQMAQLAAGGPPS